NYAVHELETLMILEALLKLEDKLMEYKIHIITNHKALEFFKTQVHLLLQQWQWINYMLQYQYDITYVKGELNKVVDCLLKYFESDMHKDVHNVHDFVQADKRIDPDGEDLPLHRFQEIVEHHIEIQAMQACEVRHSKQLKEQVEAQDLEAHSLVEAEQPSVQTLSGEEDLTIGQALATVDQRLW
ncbi:hypothetical protein C0993_007886, partial [Termitomyces sp. T159_Od127]